MKFRDFPCVFVILLIASPFLQAVRCDTDTSEVASDDGGELGIVGDNAQDFSASVPLSAAPGVETICIFPKNPKKLVTAGEETELLVGVHNQGDSPLKVLGLRASLHFPFNHEVLVQNLTVAEFYKATVPASSQASFPYNFAVSKFLQPGSFDLVGSISYEIDQQPYQSVFYNDTIEVVEAGGFLSVESVFLVTLAAALLGFLGLWVYGQIQNLSKKSKRTPKVEVGTRATEANMDEWLEGTAYAKSLSTKLKKTK